MPKWHIITGEYPPQFGGVSDYTHQLARALVEVGDEVDVWAPASPGTPNDPGVCVHRLGSVYGPQALMELDAGLRKLAPNTRLLVQYVPHMYGFKAMNVPFCAWLRARCRPAPWVMFHEIAFPVARGQCLRHNVLGRVNNVMARMVARAAERTFVSIPRWEGVLKTLARVRGPITWLPIPSTMPTSVSAESAQRTRSEFLGVGAGALIGHFGTYGGAITQKLETVLPALLYRDQNRGVILLGRGSATYVEALLRRHPELANRCHARPDLPAVDVARHLAACDVLVQPYIDGVSSRRTSMMAGLALGKAIVTTYGHTTEPTWHENRLVKFAGNVDSADLVDATEQLLADPPERAALGERAKIGYERHFSMRRTIETLRNSA